MSTPRSLDKAEALAKQYGLSQATSDYEAILSNPEVDTIYVGTPNHTHYDYAKKALLAGKHVICEKPFTLHLEEFEELAKLAQEKELLLMEAITNQYLANFTAIKEALSDIGDVKIVNINYSQYSSRYVPLSEERLLLPSTLKWVGEHLEILISIISISWLVSLVSLIVWNIYLMWSEEWIRQEF